MKTKTLSLLLLGLILLLAFNLRLTWINNINPWLYPQGIGPCEYFLGYDGVRYDNTAVNLLNHAGHGYTPNVPDSWRAPGYSFFLYTIYSLFGHNYYIIRLIQCLIGTAMCLLIFTFTRKLTKNLSSSFIISLLASLFYSLDYYSIIMTSIFYTELLTSFLILLSIYLFYISHKQKKFSYVLFSTATLILWFSVLIRPSTILFWGWIGIWLIIEHRKKIKKLLSLFSIIIFGFSLIILPWTIRNYKLHNKFLLISSNGGFIFFMANHPNSKGVFIKEGQRYSPEMKKEFKGMDTIERDKLHYHYGFKFIQNHPKKFLKLTLLKQNLLWGTQENKGLFYDFISRIPLPLLTFQFMVFFASIGLIAIRKNIYPFFLPLGYLIVHAATVSLIYIYNGPRTRIEMVPILAILAAVGFIKLLEILQKGIKQALKQK